MNEFDHLPGSRFGKAAESAGAAHHKAAMSYSSYLLRAQQTVQDNIDKVSRTSADSVRENMIARERLERDQLETARKTGAVPWTYTGQSGAFASSSPQGSESEWSGVAGSAEAHAHIKEAHRILNQQFKNPSRASTNDPDSRTPATPTMMQGFGDRNDVSGG